jgi:hypothetical protein
MHERHRRRNENKSGAVSLLVEAQESPARDLFFAS